MTTLLSVFRTSVKREEKESVVFDRKDAVPMYLWRNRLPILPVIPSFFKSFHFTAPSLHPSIVNVYFLLFFSFVVVVVFTHTKTAIHIHPFVLVLLSRYRLLSVFPVVIMISVVFVDGAEDETGAGKATFSSEANICGEYPFYQIFSKFPALIYPSNVSVCFILKHRQDTILRRSFR